jgi:hypothetical protein
MLTADFYETAKREYQSCDQTAVFSAITKAIRLLEKKAHYDASLGVLDIAVCNDSITLPNFIQTVLGVNTACGTTLLRDDWFQFHTGGVGSERWTDPGFTDVLGEVVTFRDPITPVSLVAIVESSSDNNKVVRVFGYDATGKKIYTPGPSGNLEEGFLVPAVVGYPLVNPSAPLIARIERITKVVTNGFIRLVGIDPYTNVKTLIGYYEPTDTNPRYKRMRVSKGSRWVRIKYRKAYSEIRSLNDWINIQNTLALQLAVKAVKLYEQDKYDSARQAEEEGARMLSEEEDVNKTPTAIGPQISYDYVNESDSIWDGRGYSCRGLNYPR